MSTEFLPESPIRFEAVFDGRLERHGVVENFDAEDATEDGRCLTDGNNYFWVYRTVSGETIFTRYMPNGAPGKIIAAIETEFETVLFSEYEPQFWGFETEEEWHQAWNEINEKSEEEFYDKIIKYISGEQTDLIPGSSGMIMAEIAKDLVVTDPEFASPYKKRNLLHAINEIYERNHAAIVTLDDKDVAAVRMMMTHEDDLPKA